MRHFAFCIGTGGTEVTAFGKSNYQHNDDHIFKKMLTSFRIDDFDGVDWFD